jgi:hypothetical protein
MKKRHDEEQIIRILRRRGTRGSHPEVGRQHNVSEQTFYRWPAKYGGVEVVDARRLGDRETENAKLKRLVAEQMLMIAGLKEFGKKNGDPVRTMRGVGAPDSPGHLAAQGVPLPGRELSRDELRAEAAANDRAMSEQPLTTSQALPRFGYRCMAALAVLRRAAGPADGRQMGLNIPCRRPGRRRPGSNIRVPE